MVMTIQPTNPAKVPSHVFLGLILVRGVLPKACNFSIVKLRLRAVSLVKKKALLFTLPPRKANVSVAITPLNEINVATSPTVH